MANPNPANTRAGKNAALRKENLRKELQAREYLRQIENIAVILGESWETISSEQTSALRLKADINFKRLAKVLPDLKAVEVSGPDGEPVVINILHA